MKQTFIRLAITFLVFNLFVFLSGPAFAQTKDSNPQKTLRTLVSRAVDSFFLRNCIKDEVFSTNKTTDIVSNGMGYDVWEFKEFKWELKAIKLTSAEKLNGYDFKGEIIINAKNFRQYHFCGKNSQADESKAASCNVWQEWKPFESNLGISISKKAGEWTITGVNKKLWVYLPVGTNAPKCETILKIK